MKNDRELLEALLAGKVLTYSDGLHNLEYYLNTNNQIASTSNGALCDRSLLGIATHLWTIKPETILINGIKVPAPEKAELPIGTEYYYPDLVDSTIPYYTATWLPSNNDKARLKKGLIHLTKENVKAHTKALLSFTSTEKQDV